jgi:filamentous hemagglutinin
VQPRINLAHAETRITPLTNTGKPYEAGFDHVVEGHFGVPVTNNTSVFNVTTDELKLILQSETTVSTAARAAGNGTYVRVVDVGRTIGTTNLKDGGILTQYIKIFTDRAGNLLTAFPVKGLK